MTWHSYLLSGLIVVVLLLGFGLVSLIGLDGRMWVGLAIGAAAGAGMMLFGWLTTLKALKSNGRRNALGHALGGFFLRLVVLVAGFAVLALTDVGNPAGFAVAFLMAVLVFLAIQVHFAAASMTRAQSA